MTRNPFVRDSKVVDSSKRPLDDQTLVEGRYLHVAPVHLPPTLGEPSTFQKQEALVVVNVVDHENCHLKWTSIVGASFLLKAERWQSLSLDESGKTKYESFEVFSGILAHIVKFFMQDKLNQGFAAMAQALKKRTEKET
ncbi:hypothetical protein HGRIS_006708 [Hohenbuehelia grisea]|uniref:Uncharacterized protein n=1 Tax=Hohenbuehelia grisea TaxID=104357 RepID=A0ABR3JAW5_9AGAR